MALTGAAAAAVILTPENVIAVVHSATRLLEKRRIRQVDFRENLITVKTDLGIVTDVLKAIQRKKWRKLTAGIKNWKEETSRAVGDAEQLLKRIECKNPDSNLGQNNDGSETKCCLWFRRNNLNFNSQDADDLERLKNRLDHITKHDQAVLTLLRQSRCNPL